MNYLILSLLIIVSIEVILRSNYIYLLKSLLKINKKVVNLVLNKNISDQWKEKIIPIYSIQMIKFSLSMLLIIFFIILVFFIINIFFNEFNNFIFSVKGIITSTLLGSGYVYLKKIL